MSAQPLVVITREPAYYRVTFHALTNEAIDTWLAQVAQLHRLFTVEDYVAYKVVSQAPGAPNLGYLIRAANQSIQDNPQRPSTRTAVMYRPQDSFLLGALDTFLRLIAQNPRDQVRFFGYDNEAAADRWLQKSGD